MQKILADHPTTQINPFITHHQPMRPHPVRLSNIFDLWNIAFHDSLQQQRHRGLRRYIPVTHRAVLNLVDLPVSRQEAVV